MSQLIPHRYITVEGNIGAGKTTLSTKLSKDLNGHLVLEQFADNPFLPLFYKEPERYAFPLEMFFMAERYQQLQDTLQGNLFSDTIISDYLFAKSIIFAQTTLNHDEIELYLRIFRLIYAQLPQPDIILYLHCSVPKLLDNIKKRGRPYEQDIKADYLEKIEKAYFGYFKQVRKEQKILIVPCDGLDFVNKDIDYLQIQKHLSKEYEVGIYYL